MLYTSMCNLAPLDCFKMEIAAGVRQCVLPPSFCYFPFPSSYLVHYQLLETVNSHS